MNDILNIKINWKKNIPFVLDAILEIGIGTFMLSLENKDLMTILIGITVLLIGLVQLARKIKTFHLSKTHLTIKRPLLPIKYAEMEFDLNKIQTVEFKRIIRIGPYIRIIGKTNGKDGGFMIATDKRNIDLLEKELKLLGLQVSREKI